MISSSENDGIKEEVKILGNLNKSSSDAKQVILQLNAIKVSCDKGLQHRVVAGKCGAYNALLDTLAKYKNNPDVVKHCLKTLLALMTKQPDLLDGRGVSIIISYLTRDVIDIDIKKNALRWATECCIMHEGNRQKIFDAHILDNIKEILVDCGSDVIKEALILSRALVLDDDIRVQFGKAHEHARVIASETLCSLTSLLTRFKLDQDMIKEIMSTLSALMVRTEFCKKVDDAGGIDLIRESMKTHMSNPKICKHCFMLLKALAGNDETKVNIIQKELAPVIKNALELYKGNAKTAISGLSCIAALSLRSPENSKKLYEAGLPEVIISVMKENEEDKMIQKTGSWAIRNMVSRSKYQCKTFLDLGAEEILLKNLKKFNKEIEYDVKAALRDLGCNVQFKEEWTGKGGALTTGLKYTDKN